MPRAHKQPGGRTGQRDEDWEEDEVSVQLVHSNKIFMFYSGSVF
jgi:hypothetical protein